MSPPTLDQITEVARLNEQALEALKARWGLTLPEQSGVRWRVCKESTGEVPGISFALTILCTDGCVAWFRTADDGLFHGHIQHFSGEVKPMYSVTRDKAVPDVRQARSARQARSPRKPSTKSLAKNLLDLL